MCVSFHKSAPDRHEKRGNHHVCHVVTKNTGGVLETDLHLNQIFVVLMLIRLFSFLFNRQKVGRTHFR